MIDLQQIADNLSAAGLDHPAVDDAVIKLTNLANSTRTTPMADEISKVCPDCYGDGKRCLAGHSAHRDNWYVCESCKGTGRIESAATPKDQP